MVRSLAPPIDSRTATSEASDGTNRSKTGECPLDLLWIFYSFVVALVTS